MHTLLLLAVLGCTDKDTTASDTGGTTASDSGLTGDSGVVDADADGVPAHQDCDDSDPSVGAAFPVYEDVDGDGYGDDATETTACDVGEGWSEQGGDCDVEEATINPGAQEVCDDAGTDEDCDSLVDDADDSVDASTGSEFPVDADGDGYGDADTTVWACDEPAGTPDNTDDCNDDEASVNPDATEICDDGWDNDCDGTANGCGLYGDALIEDVAAVRYIGPEGGYTGVAMSYLGDQDGDGLPEALLGDPQHDAADNNEGIAWVVYSGATGDIDLMTQADVTLVGDVRGIAAGSSVHGLGDYDGDGIADVTLGAPSGSVGYEDQAYVIYGPVSTDGTIAGLADAMFTEQAHAGTNLDSADFDGDGASDLIVTSLTGSTRHEVSNSGAVHVITGGARWSGGAELADVSAHEFYGETSSSWLGGAGSGQDGVAAGDLNADGLPDLVMGSKNYDNYQGRGYVFLSPLPTSPTNAGDADWWMEGQGSDDTADVVAVAEDLDGDGYGDLLISEADAGRTLVFLGSDSWSGDTDSGGRDHSLYANTYPFHPGTHISTGDIDGDGQEDILLGDEYHSDYAGGAWVIYGPLTASVDLETEVGAGNIGALTGPDDARVGRAAVTGHDANGDGRDDLLLGSEYYAHTAYLVFSSGI